MKKTAFTVIVFVVVVALLLVFLQQKTARTVHASDFAPANTLVFVRLPDVQRSQLRWPQTALAKIAAEPEVQAFLEKPRSKAPEMKKADETLARLKRAQIGEAFVALTEVDGADVDFLAGFSSAGTPEDVNALLAAMRAEWLKAQPDGKSGHETYGKAEIETIVDEYGIILAAWIHGGGWTLLSNDLDTLKAAIDRRDGKADPAAKSLAQSELFATALGSVSKEADAEVFGDVEAIARRVLPLVSASGVQVPDEAQAMIKQAKALAYTLKMDGAQFREAAFLLSPGGKAQPQLPLHTLAISTAATAIVLSNALPGAGELSASVSSIFALVPGFAEFEKALAGAGMKTEDFGKIFGPEFGAVLDWPAADSTPSFALTLDLRDAAKAKAAASALTDGNQAWTKSEHAGALVLTQKMEGQLALVQPTIGLGDKFAVVGLSLDGVNAILDRAAAPHERIDAAPTYQAATKLVAPPTSSFAFIDVKALFERTYGTLRPLALLALALQPEASQYIDAGKLPNTATIAQHLTPIVYSNSTSDRGTLIESTGPVTLSQVALVFGGAAAGVVSSGQLKPGGALDPGALGLPSIPGLTPQAPKPPVPTLPILPDLPDPPAESQKPEENPAAKPQ
jgi:hypothetical protein